MVLTSFPFHSIIPLSDKTQGINNCDNEDNNKINIGNRSECEKSRNRKPYDTWVTNVSVALAGPPPVMTDKWKIINGPNDGEHNRCQDKWSNDRNDNFTKSLP